MTISSDFGYDISSLGLYTTNSEYIEYIDDFEVVDDSIVFTLDTTTLDLLSDGVIKYKIYYADTTSEESNTNYILKTPDTYSARTSEDFYEEGYEKGYKEGVGSKLVPVIMRTVEEITAEDLSGCTTIGNAAFQGCGALTGITLPDTITSIGDGAFRSCSGLTSITIPDSVATIGTYAFTGSNIKQARISSALTEYRYAYRECPSLESAIIEDGSVEIAQNAFDRCYSLSSVTIPNSVTGINNSAFYACQALKDIDIPTSVIRIGNSAFYGCASLENIAVSYDGSKYALSLKNTFYGCSSLTGITFNDLKTYPSQIRKPGAVPIDESAFRDCSSLREMSLHSQFGDSVPVFYKIPRYAFYNCSSLSSITIEGGTSYIDNNGLANCSSLERIIVDSFNVELRNINALTNTNNCPIYVPDGVVDYYKTATNWSAYANRIKPMSELGQ